MQRVGVSPRVVRAPQVLVRLLVEHARGHISRCHSPPPCRAAPSGLGGHSLHGAPSGYRAPQRPPASRIRLDGEARSRTDRAWGYHTTQVLKSWRHRVTDARRTLVLSGVAVDAPPRLPQSARSTLSGEGTLAEAGAVSSWTIANPEPTKQCALTDCRYDEIAEAMRAADDDPLTLVASRRAHASAHRRKPLSAL